MTSIELTLTPAFYGSINPAIQLDQFYPSLPDNYINTADSQISADRIKWDARERAALDENRTVQNQSYRNLNQTAALLTVDLEKSNQAPGMTSVIQNGNEVVALLINQLQTLTTQEMTDARTAVEQEARAQAEEAYAQHQLQSVRAGWEHPATPVTHLTDPFSNAK